MKSETRYHFGDKLRKVRERKKLTMKSVAQQIGVSESLISQIERNRVSPSLDTLLSISEVLQIDLEYLFLEFKKDHKVDIVRADQRNTMEMNHVRYEQLTSFSDANEKHAVEAFIISIDPGEEKGDVEYGHEGKELGIIIHGKGQFFYGTQVYELSEGDSISFNSDIPHRLLNSGEDILQAVWVTTPPRLFT